MSILINKNTKFIVRGITGTQGRFHTKLMKDYSPTSIAAGVTPGKGGETVEGIQVFNTMKEALTNNPAEWCVHFVPAPFVLKAALEDLENNLNLVIITEHVPIQDTLKIINEAQKRNLIAIGPNCPGIITPEEIKIGIMPGHIFQKGKVGIISRSGTLTYEVVENLTRAGIGQSTVIGIGGDPVPGLNFIEVLDRLEKDPETEKIILIGEIGGEAEEAAAKFIKNNIKKPVIAYIAGKTAPQGKTMGHAGAVISGNTGTAETKIEALKKAGVKVAEVLSEVTKLIR